MVSLKAMVLHPQQLRRWVVEANDMTRDQACVALLCMLPLIKATQTSAAIISDHRSSHLVFTITRRRAQPRARCTSTLTGAPANQS